MATEQDKVRDIFNNGAQPGGAEALLPDDIEAQRQEQGQRHAQEEAQLRAAEMSPDDAIRLGRILKERGRDGMGEEAFGKGMATFRAFMEANPQVAQQLKGQGQQQPQQGQQPVTVTDNTVPQESGFFTGPDSFLKSYGEQFVGLGTVGTSLLNSALAEPVVGWRGLVHVVLNKGDAEGAAEKMDEWRKALTFDWASPNEAGQAQLEAVAKPIAKADEVASDFAAWGFGFGDNPWVATGIYTTLMGGVDILGIKGGRAIKTSKNMKAAEKMAKDMGIKPVAQTMPSDIIDVAAKMTPETRAANAGQLQVAMREAQETAARRVETLRTRVNNQPAFVSTKDTRAFGAQVRNRLVEEGYDLDTMPTARKRLAEIENIEGPRTRQTGDNRVVVPESKVRSGTPEQTHLQDWMLIRNRIEKDLIAKRRRSDIPETTNELTVLNRVAREMDDGLEKQFANDLISGDPNAINAWKDFDQARRQVLKDFNADKTIMKLIDIDADPEQIKRWVIGMNGVNANPQMASAVKRMKNVLGKDSPAFVGIQQDFLFDIMEPLYNTQPNLNQFVKNIDIAMRRQQPVLRALDINQKDLRAMRNWAQTSINNPPSKTVKLIQDGAKFLARMSPLAHGIARAGAKVSFATNAFRKMMGSNRASQKQILADFTGAQFGGPVFDRGAVNAGRVIQAAFMSDLQKAGGVDNDEEVGENVGSSQPTGL